ncbi:MAG: aspartate aminotransferase family protein, partial [Planctomycetota bacterium]
MQELLHDTAERAERYLAGLAERPVRPDPAAIEALQEDGTCWCSGTTWQGHTAMRISVSSWRTTEEDV